MSLIEHETLSRRTFLKAGGALVVMTAVPAALRAPLAWAAAGGGPYPAVDPAEHYLSVLGRRSVWSDGDQRSALYFATHPGPFDVATGGPS